MLKSKRIAFAFLSLCLLFPVLLSAQSEKIIRFSDKLNEEKLFDFSEYLLTKAIAASPADVDRLKVQLAETYLTMGVPDKANAILSKISSSSKYYPSGQLALGIASCKRRKVDDGIKYLNNYLALFKDKAPEDDAGKAEFREAVNYLVWAYKEKGDAVNSSRVIKMLDIIKADKRETILYELISKLDSAETQKEEKKKGWEAIVTSTLQPFEDLRWGGQDAISLFSYVERGRALYMLGKYDESLKELEGPPELLKVFDDAFRKEDKAGASPMAAKKYWEGKNYLAKATAAKDNNEKKKEYGEAIKKFLYLLMKNPGYAHEDKAYSSLLLCKENFEKLGGKIKLPDKFKPPQKATLTKVEAAPINTAEADQLFKDKKYDKTVPMYIDIVLKNRGSEALAAPLYKLSLSYAYTKNHIEAVSVAKYLAGRFPSTQEAAFALLQIGQLFRENKMMDDAIEVYELFLATAPANQYAGDISALIAKEYYDRAVALAKDANKSTGDDKVRKTKIAKNAFIRSAPRIKRVFDKYSNRKELAVSSYFMLANAYNSANMYKEAADTYLDFCKNQQDDPVKLVNAKLGAADSFYQGGQFAEKNASEIREEAYTMKSELKTKKLAEAEQVEKTAKDSYKNAVSNLEELLGKWTASGGVIANSSDAKVQKVLQSAQLLLGWAYDSCGDKKKASIAFQKFIEKYPSSDKVPLCMSRLGALYYELNDYNASTKILETLASKYPNTPEAKNAYFNLGRNMYEVDNFSKAFEVFNKLFAQKTDISPANLRWMASNLANCKQEHPKEGAKLALKSAAMLLKMIETPNLVDWVGQQMAAELKNNAAERTKTIDTLKQKILFDAANAAYWTGDIKASMIYFDDLLSRKDTPYFYKAKFARADFCIGTKDYEKARRDLGDISMSAMASRRDALSSKAKCLIGETYMLEKNYAKAFASFDLIAKSLRDESAFKDIQREMSEDERKIQEEERAAEKEWVEFAVYKGAFCAAKLGREDDKKRLVAQYKKFFPKGKFSSEIGKLPAPEAANK